MVTDPAWPGGGEYRGVEAFRRFMSQFLEPFESIRFAPERAPEPVGATTALFHGAWVGRGAASGIEAATPGFWVVFEVAGERVREMRFFFRERAAREFVSRA